MLIGCCISISCTDSFAKSWEWSLQTGDKFDVTLGHETVSTTAVGDYKAQQTYRYQLQTTWNIQGVDDIGIATIEKTVRSIRFEIESESPVAFDVKVDTATGAASGKTISGTTGATILTHMQSLVGKTALMKMRPNGETEALPMPAATQAIVDAFPKSDYTLQLFDIKSVAESETAYLVSFPAKEKSPGTTWRRESNRQVHANAAFVTEFTYVGETKTDGKAVDEFAIEVKPKKHGDRKVPANAAEPATVSKQIGTGTCFFDVAKKHFTSAKYHSEIVSTSPGQQSVITSDSAIEIVRK